MTETTKESFDYITLLRFTTERLTKGRNHLIGIDGFLGAGKTTLAEKLSGDIVCRFISLDNYLNKNKGTYLDNINYRKLSRTVSSQSGSLIIEGICLLSILKRCSIMPNILIYIKRFDKNGIWIDEDELAGEEGPDIIISRSKANQRKILLLLGEQKSASPYTCAYEIIRYHHSYKPHEKADYIFSRVC